MAISRRGLLKRAAAAGSVAALPSGASAREERVPSPTAVGLLFDSTLCVGCRGCQSACKRANELPADRVAVDGAEYDAPIDLNSSTKTIIKATPVPGGLAFIKQGCMHCVDPACVSACMLGALHKEGEGKRVFPGERKGTGLVLWDKYTCVGCRYCQVACPFNAPKFEWFEPFPYIVKCELCRHRARPTAKRALAVANPACAEVCPRGAVIYGYRADLLAEAKRRLAAEPGRYSGRVYGETDGGGTQVLVLAGAGISFEQLGLPTLRDRSPAHFSESVSHAPYLYGFTPIALYAAFSLVLLRNKRKEEVKSAGHEEGR